MVNEVSSIEIEKEKENNEDDSPRKPEVNILTRGWTWTKDKFWGAFKNPYCSNLLHPTQWDWRHGVTALAGTAVLSYYGIKYVPKIYDKYDDIMTRRATKEIDYGQSKINVIRNEFKTILLDQTEKRQLIADSRGEGKGAYPLHLLEKLHDESKNLEKILLKKVRRLPNPYPQVLKELIEKNGNIDTRGYTFPMLKLDKEILRQKIKKMMEEDCLVSKRTVRNYIGALKDDATFFDRYVNHDFIKNTIIPLHYLNDLSIPSHGRTSPYIRKWVDDIAIKVFHEGR